MPRHWPWTLVSLLACAGPAAAETSPWYVGASQTFTHEDNVYRLADGVSAPEGVSKSDLISTTALLAGLDQPIGRQRLYGSAALKDNRFQDNGQLDNRGYSIDLGLDWETIERISGQLNLSAHRNLARFNTDTELGLLTKQNIETAESASAVVRVGVVTKYTAEAGLEYRQVRYSAAEFDARENDQTTATLGLRYRPVGATVLGVGLRHVQGQYPHFEPLDGGGYRADEYRENGVDFTLAMKPGGSSRIDGRLTLGKTRYDRATQRDRSGVTGAVSWSYDPGGRWSARLRLARDDGQNAYFNDSESINGFVDYSRTTDTLNLRGDYELTGKIKLNAVLNHARRDLVRTLPADSTLPADAEGTDRTTRLSLGATWEPTRSIVVGCDLGHERRQASGDLTRPYRANTVGCYGQIFLR